MDSELKMNKQILEVADGIGDFIEYWGFKKIHGKIWSLIFLAEKPVDANYLIKNLGVSKALVSISLKDLIYHNVIIEVKEKNSTQHYQSNPQMADVIIEVLLKREAMMLSKIKSACEILNCLDENKIKPHATMNRSKKLEQMVATADRALKTFITLKQFSFKDVSKILNMKNKKDELNGELA